MLMAAFLGEVIGRLLRVNKTDVQGARLYLRWGCCFPVVVNLVHECAQVFLMLGRQPVSWTIPRGGTLPWGVAPELAMLPVRYPAPVVVLVDSWYFHFHPLGHCKVFAWGLA